MESMAYNTSQDLGNEGSYKISTTELSNRIAGHICQI